MRTELNQHLQTINQIYSLYLGAVAVLFAGAFTSRNYDLLYLVPFLGFGAASLLGSHDKAISCIAAYCAKELDEVFKATDSHITQWDNSTMLRDLKDRHYNSQRGGGLMIIVSPGVIALLFTMNFKNTLPLSWSIDTFGLFTGLFFIISAIGVIWDTAEYRRKMGRDPGSPSEVLSLSSWWIRCIRMVFTSMRESKRRKTSDVLGNPDLRVTGVAFTEDRLVVTLADRRSVSVPLAWFPRLLNATSQERSNWETAGAGCGIHWPDVDEYLSVERLLRGAPAPQARPLVS